MAAETLDGSLAASLVAPGGWPEGSFADRRRPDGRDVRVVADTDSDKPVRSPGADVSLATKPKRLLTWRLCLLAGGVMLALVVVAAVGWFFWLPDYRPALGPGEAYGIDVSAYQGRIDWGKVADDHISFAYIKATEGGDFIDQRFAANWRAARQAGVARGAYHFFSLCSSGLAQAHNYLTTVPAEPGALAPAVDLELAGNCHQRPSAAAVDGQLRTFLRTVESRTGHTAVIYLGSDFAHRYPVAATARRPLWLRRFLRPPDSGRWLIWQVGGYAHVSGIDGDVDLDVMRHAKPHAKRSIAR